MYNFCLLLLMMMMIERSFVLSLGAQTSYRTAAIFGWLLLLRLSLPLPLLLLFYRCFCLLTLVRLFTRLSGSKFSIKILDFAASLRVCVFFSFGSEIRRITCGGIVFQYIVESFWRTKRFGFCFYRRCCRCRCCHRCRLV